jgi:hypothetical protein
VSEEQAGWTFAFWLEQLDAEIGGMSERDLEALKAALDRAHATGDVQEAAEWLAARLSEKEVTPNETP